MNWKTTRESLLQIEQEINAFCEADNLPINYQDRLQAHILEQVRAKIVQALSTAWRKKKDTAALKLLPIEMEVMVRCIDGTDTESQYLLLKMGSKI